MSNHILAARNLGLKALRVLGTAHKPLVRLVRRGGRAQEQLAFRREARAVEREIARIGAGRAPIVAGPWLAEVGYEALYWVPFLRWFADAYRVPPERLVVLSRGGVRDWYRGIAASYVDIFDQFPPADLAARNDARRLEAEEGGRKQSSVSRLDAEIVAYARAASGHRDAQMLHPSLMFRLFRHVWHGNLPFDFFWTRARYALIERPPRPAGPSLPREFVAAKFYSGTALPDTAEHRAILREIVASLAERLPVVTLDTGLAVDDHDDFAFNGIPNVTSARDWMRPGDNLGVQSAVIAHAQLFVGTCGGLAWLAPFFGTPSVAVYADDRHLAPHLFIAHQARRRAGAADFLPLDIRALARVGGI